MAEMPMAITAGDWKPAEQHPSLLFLWMWVISGTLWGAWGFFFLNFFLLPCVICCPQPPRQHAQGARQSLLFVLVGSAAALHSFEGLEAQSRSVRWARASSEEPEMLVRKKKKIKKIPNQT